MSFVRTVLGDIAPHELGVCYAHEHLIIDPSFTTHLYPDFLLDSVDRAAEDVAAFRGAGGRAMVDSMPCGGGRNVLKLADLSRRTGVHILCPTGLHLAKYYPPGHWGDRLGVPELADLFVADIRDGIDANDYNGPAISRTSHRAGLIKIASSLDRIDGREQKVFEAAALAHVATGAPILTHTEQGTAALEQVETLGRHGVRPEHVVLSHTDRKPDVGYHREILSTSVFVEFDSAFRWPADRENPTLRLVVDLFGLGFGGQVMLGMDAARRGYWRSYGGRPGLSYLLTTFAPQLKDAGLSDADLAAIFGRNPARAYAFARPATEGRR